MTNAENEPLLRRRSWLSIVWQVSLGAAVVGLVLAYGATYQVSEGYSAVVTRFGDPVAIHTAHGHRESPWRFSGRWWSKPIPVRRNRPWL